MKILTLTHKEVVEHLERLHAEARNASWRNDHHALDVIEGQIIAWREILNRMTDMLDIKI